MAKLAGATATKGGATRRRLASAERERLIVEAAIRFFAEEGFHGQTRALATQMGLSHSVLYRHFPSKEALIERVYNEVYLRRWAPDWAAALADRTTPFPRRLEEFYVDYARTIFERDWVRIFVFAGMKNVGITGRYYAQVRERIVLVLCREMRAHLCLPTPEMVAVSHAEEEAFWSLHGGIFFIAIRKFVYGVPVPGPIEDRVREIARRFLRGAADYPALVDAAAMQRRGKMG